MRRALLALSVGAFLALPTAAQASSHREAPFVTKNPKVDGTDFYIFNSYEAGRTGFVTIVADYQPLQDAYGGPNYFQLDPDALYEIMIDNTGDAVEDLTFQFQFSQALANSGNGIALNIGYPDGGAQQTVAIPLFNAGPIATAANLNVLETYSVNVVAGDRRTGTSAAVKDAGSGSTTFTKPADNLGVKSFPAPGYQTYANQYVYNITIPNCATAGKMFVGQRAEPFAVNIGPIFDLIDAPKTVVAGGAPNTIPTNPIGNKNVTTLALELPASCITQSSSQPIVGAWTTASVRQARVLNPGATYTVPSHEGGAWTQVSRLSTPLVNEVVIGLPDKDHFNASSPKDDAQFAKYVTNPTLPALIDVLFGPGLAPQLFPRADLVAAFLTGVTGVNAFPKASSPATAEMLRLNTSIAANTGAQNYLGAAACFVKGVLTPSNPGCDTSGFPNGRRPGDDVVDIALDVMMGYLIGDSSIAPANGVAFTDGVQQIYTQFDSAFPYLKTPNQGANGNGT
jgi:hypothetical protein